LSARRILIVTHSGSAEIQRSTYTVRYLAQEWERLGFDVVVTSEAATSISADVVINHVDLTVTPDAYVDCFARYPVVINGALMDISKRRFSRNLLGPSDVWSGKVIVKTNANYGGVHEARLKRPSGLSAHQVFRRAARVISRLRGWAAVEAFDGGQYPVLAKLQDVPSGVWRNPNLIVEKFLPEPDEDGNWRLRAWSFLGDKSLHVLTTASAPVVKGAVISKREILPADAVPEPLLRLRAQLRADYGRLDYALVDGQPILYDVNRTPTTSTAALAAYATPLTELARGILCY
jgi:hypothetical protein